MMKTLSANNIASIHTFLAKEFDGKYGLRDRTALSRLTAEINGNNGKELFERATGLLVGIVKYTPFIERNLRTAFFTTDVFLRMNGFYLRCDAVLTQRFLLALLEENRFTKETILPWIQTNAERLNP
jgi:death-on-curing protein